MAAVTTRGKSLYALTAFKLIALVFCVVNGVLAQTSTSVVEITLTAAPESYVLFDLRK